MAESIPGTPSAMAISRPSARPLNTPAPRLPEPALAWRVQGEWIIGQTAGGNPTHESWVMNDQFQLLPSADGETEFKVLLRQELEPGASPESAVPICVFIVDALDDRRKRRVIDPKTAEGGDPFRLIKASGAKSRGAELRARAALPRRPLPFLVVPCAQQPNAEGRFTLEVVGSKPFVLFGPLPLRAGAANAAIPFDEPSAGARAPARARGGNARGAELGAGRRAAPAPALPPPSEGDAGAELGAALRQALEGYAARSRSLPFEDSQLPPTAGSLHGDAGAEQGAVAAPGARPVEPLAWLRPLRFASARAALYGVSAQRVGAVIGSPRFDDGWLLAAISAVGTSPRPELLARVLGANGEAYAQREAGVAAVRLWTGERWEAIIVDDLLPCAQKRCAVGCSADPTALWVSLIEKAFVKRFARSYAALAGAGDVGGALVALTGGSAETVDLRGAQAHAEFASGGAWARLLARVAEGAVLVARAAPAGAMGGAVGGSDLFGGGARTPHPPPAAAAGLLPGSHYTLLDAQTVGGLQLVCLRNLFGLDEWRGSYADSDAAGWAAPVDGGKTLAATLAPRTRFPVPFAGAGGEDGGGGEAGADGIFWMAFADFVGRFSELVEGRPLGGNGWAAAVLPGRWEAQCRGGSLERPSWRLNPQYRLSVAQPTRLVIKLAPAGAQPERRGGEAGARVGWALLRAMAGTQRKVALAPSDILKTSEAVVSLICAGAAAEVELAPTNGAFGYVLVPYCEADGAPTAAELPPLSFSLCAYAALQAGGAPSAADWSIAPIEPGDDWHALTCAGAWEGTTAGGCPNAANLGTWLLNPHFTLAVSRPTRVQLLLDVHVPSASGRGPPPAVGAMLLTGGAGGGRKKSLGAEDVLAQTGYQRATSLSAECLLEPSAEPYWLLASTLESGVRGNFTLTLYSDSEISATAVSGGGAVFRGARAASSARLNVAPNQPLPALTPSRANLSALPAPPPSGALQTAAAGLPLSSAGGGGADGGEHPSMRRMAQSLQMKDARIAELERKLARAAAAAGAVVDEAEDEAAMGPRPSMLEAPPTADESWPQVAKLGQGLSDAQKKGMRAELRAIEARCAETGAKWEDPRFHASDMSLPAGIGARVGQVTWRRPDEIAQGARLWLSEWEIAGVTQGALNDRHFISAANIVASNPELIHRVFVDTSLSESCGALAFRFHATDSWEVVLIDDRLPCGPDGRPLFGSCPDDHIFWLPLLEKAYAKFVGGYERLDRGGTVTEALEDLTGSDGEKILLTSDEARARLPGGEAPDELWSQLLVWLHSGYVVGCQYNVKHAADGGAFCASAAEVAAMGLEPNRAYAVLTGGQMGGEKLLRLRAPSAAGEWRGAWSDKSDRWSMRMRQMLNYKEDENDGTFWIAWEDFVRHFNKLYALRMLDDLWTKVVCRGAWAGLSAGGATNFGTWRHNPQWVIRPRRQALRMHATLTQLNAAPGRAEAGGDGGGREGYAHAIGLFVFRGNPPPDDARRKLYLANEDELVAMREPAFKRSVTLEFEIEPSETPYVIMPCCFEPGCEGQFSLTLRCDDLDDDGVPDFDMVPVGPPTDWHCTTIAHAWKGESAGGARAHDTWRNNPQFYLVPSARSRIFVFLDLPDASVGGRVSPEELPPIQLTIARGDGMAKVSQVGPGNLAAESEFFRDDGLSLELSLGRASRKAPYVVIPSTMSPGEEASFSISVYSEHPFEFASFEGAGEFPLCTTCQSLCPQLGSASGGPLDLLLERLGEIEGRFVKLEKTRYWEKIPQLKAGGTPLEGAFGAKPKPAASRTLADAIAAGEAGKGPANGANDQSAVCTIA